MHWFEPFATYQDRVMRLVAMITSQLVANADEIDSRSRVIKSDSRDQVFVFTTFEITTATTLTMVIVC